MVKKFEEFISEGLWSKTFDRARTGETRFEDGRKYKTSLGETIEIHCSSSDIEDCIDKVLNREPDYGGIYYDIEDYDEGYLIGQDIDDEPVKLIFDEYDEDKFENISPDDYEAIQGCVINAIKNAVSGYTIVVRNNTGYVMLVGESDMDSLCSEDEDRFDDNSGYARLIDKVREYVGNKNGYETDDGIEGLGDEPHYLAVRINRWFIDNFEGLYKFIKSEWDNLLNYDPYEDEEEE